MLYFFLSKSISSKKNINPAVGSVQSLDVDDCCFSLENGGLEETSLVEKHFAFLHKVESIIFKFCFLRSSAVSLISNTYKSFLFFNNDNWWIK